MKFLSDWLKEWVFKNIFIKTVSLVLGIFLWGYVNSRGEVEMNFLVPLQLKNLSESWIIAGRTPEYVEVRVKGRESTLANLTATRLVAILDLSKASLGENTFYLHSEDINVPSNVEVTHLLPKTLSLKIEAKGKR